MLFADKGADTHCRLIFVKEQKRLPYVMCIFGCVFAARCTYACVFHNDKNYWNIKSYNCRAIGLPHLM